MGDYYQGEDIEARRLLFGIKAGEWKEMCIEAKQRGKTTAATMRWWLEQFLDEVAAGRNWRDMKGQVSSDERGKEIVDVCRQ